MNRFSRKQENPLAKKRGGNVYKGDYENTMSVSQMR